MIPYMQKQAKIEILEDRTPWFPFVHGFALITRQSFPNLALHKQFGRFSCVTSPEK